MASVVDEGGEELEEGSAKGEDDGRSVEPLAVGTGIADSVGEGASEEDSDAVAWAMAEERRESCSANVPDEEVEVAMADEEIVVAAEEGECCSS